MANVEILYILIYSTPLRLTIHCTMAVFLAGTKLSASVMRENVFPI